MNKNTLAKMIDHTLLKQNASSAQIEKLCGEAKQYGFASVCINPCYVPLCADLLKDSDVNVCTVIGFPLGATTSDAKAFEAANAVRNGAAEVDMVINVGFIKSGKWEETEKDIAAVVTAAKAENADTLVKVILETCLLTDEEKELACKAAVRAGADFVKTSTGFSTGGATVADIALMRKAVGPDLGVKASGGIHTTEEALALIDAGATRIGASAGIAIVEGL